MASAEFEPANLGTKGQHANPRPPKIVNSLNLYTCWNFIVQMATLDSAFKYLIMIFSFKILFRCLHTAVTITSLQM